MRRLVVLLAVGCLIGGLNVVAVERGATRAVVIRELGRR